MWTLIITVVVYAAGDVPTVQSVSISSSLGFASQATCLRAANVWADHNNKLLPGLTAGTALCVPNAIDEPAPQRPLSKY